MDAVINRIIGLAEKSMARPLVGRVVLLLLMSAFSVALLAFAGGWRVDVNGKIGPLGVSLRYDNDSQTAVCLIVTAILIAVAVWLFRRYHRPAHFKSDRIAELEDMYAAKGSVDSVRQKFREVYSVWVTKDELDYLMAHDGRSELAASLRKARAQVHFKRPQGFSKIKPRLPYRVLASTFVAIYAIAAVACMFWALCILAAVFQQAWSGVVTYSMALMATLAIAGVSLSAYGACHHTLELTRDQDAGSA